MNNTIINSWKEIPKFALPECIKGLLDKEILSNEDYEFCKSEFNKDDFFKVLRNGKVSYKLPVVPKGYCRCNNCGNIWDGYAQCLCWQYDEMSAISMEINW